MENFLGCLGAIVLTVAVFLLCGLIVWWLWGAIAVAAFGLPVLTYWQCYGLLWLCNLLFGGTKTVNNYYKNWRK